MNSLVADILFCLSALLFVESKIVNLDSAASVRLITGCLDRPIGPLG